METRRPRGADPDSRLVHAHGRALEVLRRARAAAVSRGHRSVAQIPALRGPARKPPLLAYRLRDAAGTVEERSKDDGEVGHPGRVLLEILRRHDLEGVLLVSRVFGGVKLGVGGVSRAFREAGEGAIAAAGPGASGGDLRPRGRR